MKWFNNLKIAKKLIIGFLVVAVLAAVVGVVGIANLISIRNEDTKMYSEEALGLQYSGESAVNLMQLRYFILKLLTVSEEKDINDVMVNVEQFANSTDESLTKFFDEITVENSDIETILNTIKTNWATYMEETGQLKDYISANNIEAMNDFLLNTMAPLGVTLRDDFMKLMQFVAEEAAHTAKSNAALANSALITMIVIVVVAVIIAIILGTYISKNISYPIKKMAALGKLLSKGDLNINSVLVEKDYGIKDQMDETGELAMAFHELITTTTKQVNAIQKLSEGDLTIDFTAASENDRLGKSLLTLIDSLNGLIGSIMSSSDQVSSGASMVSNSSMSLSQGATEQASSVEQLTASLDEIASQTNLNAQNASKANELAHEARDNAANGNEQMKEMLQAMDEISASSANINKIIKVIDDIAFQTNILALNAAVEAARAGQHGKGFAVVAEEVRTLAAKSAQAAKETTDLIENSIRKVEAGTKIANETAGALGQIVDQVDKAAELVHSIASASSEQAIGVDQINQGIVQVSQVVQTNAATAEESAAASEELSAQAEQLRETVSVFKIKNSALRRESGAISQKRVAAALPSRGTAKALRASIDLEDGSFGKY